MNANLRKSPPTMPDGGSVELVAWDQLSNDNINNRNIDIFIEVCQEACRLHVHDALRNQGEEKGLPVVIKTIIVKSKIMVAWNITYVPC